MYCQHDMPIIEGVSTCADCLPSTGVGTSTMSPDEFLASMFGTLMAPQNEARIFPAPSTDDYGPKYEDRWNPMSQQIPRLTYPHYAVVTDDEPDAYHGRHRLAMSH